MKRAVVLLLSLVASVTLWADRAGAQDQVRLLGID